MFIRLRDNAEGVLAVNLNASQRILIYQNAGEFVLAVGTESTAIINIESYPTHERAIQAFESMMDRLEGGRPFCYSHEL